MALALMINGVNAQEKMSGEKTVMVGGAAMYPRHGILRGEA